LRKILHIDMDDVLVDFESGLERVPQDVREKFGDGFIQFGSAEYPD